VTTEDTYNNSANEADQTSPDIESTITNPMYSTAESSGPANADDDKIESLIQERARTKDAEKSDDDSIQVPRIVFNYLMIAIVFFAIGIVTGSFAFPSVPQSNLPDDFEAVVRGAVADVLADAGIQAEDPGPQTGDRFEIAYDADDPYMGNPDGSIVIVEFSDFLCGFCGRFAEETLPLIMDEYGDDVRFVYRDFPVIQPQASPLVALAAECADDQGKFWEYHDLLFANTSSIAGTETLYGFAAQLELDEEQFGACFENGTHLDEIQADEAYARELGLRGTPGFFINGRFVNGAVPFATFQQIIDEELAALG
jgi:protein-disulfide isomerase